MNGNKRKKNNTKIAAATRDLFVMKKTLKKIKKLDRVKEDPTENHPKEMTVDELQARLDSATSVNRSKIRLLEIFGLIYNEGVEILKSNKTIFVSNLVYLTEVSKYLNSLKTYQIDLWIWWNVVYTLGPHTDVYILRFLNFIDAVESADLRTETCSELVMGQFKPVASYMFMSRLDSEIKKSKVKHMLAKIKEEFISLIKKVSWMDNETKEMALKKVSTMKDFIGYPDKWKNLTYLKSQIKDYNETNHLQNVLDFLKTEYAGDDLKDLNVVSTPDEPAEDFDSMEINSFYDSEENSISIPAAILQFPFYDLGLEALNYGAIGILLGHELTHGLDNDRKDYDHDGYMKNWWSEMSDAEYRRRTSCFINDYGSFFIEAVNRTVNGTLTLAENIADSGGILEAFNAYQKYVVDHGPEPNLPGFENFTSNQLFFMSHAMSYCGEYTKESLSHDLKKDEHSPGFVRVLVTLRNSPEFAEAWNCPKGSNMNPLKEKCQLWVG